MTDSHATDTPKLLFYMVKFDFGCELDQITR